MKKFWNKYKSAIIAAVSYLVGFNIGEVIKDNTPADEPIPVVIEQTESAQGEVLPDTAQADEPSGIQPSVSPSSFDYSALDWCWGGFKGGSAKQVDGVEISNLKVNYDGMSYSWKSGGCEKLGASSKTDASCLACLFCKVDGKWVGGKFDWISTSRTSRDFKNIHDGYNGWNPKALTSAKEYAFVIVSKDGKRRSNVVTCGR
jgi:hypothetical protein